MYIATAHTLFERETEERTGLSVEDIDKALRLWADAVKQTGLSPNYDGEYGSWDLAKVEDVEVAVKEARVSAERVMGADYAWNQHAQLLKRLGVDHPFVKGFLSATSPSAVSAPWKVPHWKHEWAALSPAQFLDSITLCVRSYPETYFRVAPQTFYLGLFAGKIWEVRREFVAIDEEDLDPQVPLPTLDECYSVSVYEYELYVEGVGKFKLSKSLRDVEDLVPKLLDEALGAYLLPHGTRFMLDAPTIDAWVTEIHAGQSQSKSGRLSCLAPNGRIVGSWAVGLITPEAPVHGSNYSTVNLRGICDFRSI